MRVQQLVTFVIRFRMVTLDGTELRTGGSYAGGSQSPEQQYFIKARTGAITKEIAEEEVFVQKKWL